MESENYFSYSVKFYNFVSGVINVICMLQVVNSFLEAKQDKLISILCNPRGSHIGDAIFESEFIGEKSREKFIKALEVSKY